MSPDFALPESLFTRCGNCGYPEFYHRQDPAYYRAEELEPGVTQSVAEKDRKCEGWRPRAMTLAQARELRP